MLKNREKKTTTTKTPVCVCMFAQARDLLWKYVGGGRPQKLMGEFGPSPALRTWVPQPSQHADGQFCAGTFQRSPFSTCQAFKPAKGFGIEAAPRSVPGCFWESSLGGKKRYVH